MGAEENKGMLLPHYSVILITCGEAHNVFHISMIPCCIKYTAKNGIFFPPVLA